VRLPPIPIVLPTGADGARNHVDTRVKPAHDDPQLHKAPCAFASIPMGTALRESGNPRALGSVGRPPFKPGAGSDPTSRGDG
jgi:hypothetical protein